MPAMNRLSRFAIAITTFLGAVGCDGSDPPEGAADSGGGSGGSGGLAGSGNSGNAGTPLTDGGSELDAPLATDASTGTDAAPDFAARPNEPAGYVPWFEHDWQTWPTKEAHKMMASEVGMIDWASGYDNFELVDDPSAPHGKSKSLRHRQPAGQQAGVTGGVFNLLNPKPGAGTSHSLADQVPLESFYRHHWVYFEPDPVTGDWQFGDSHMRTFWANRPDYNGQANIGLKSPANPRPPNRYDYFDGASIWYYAYEGATSTIKYATVPGLAVGQWHRFEYLWETENNFKNVDDSDGQNDSRVRIWINESVVFDQIVTHHMFYPFTRDHFAMVWSGGGGASNPNVRSQDDFIRFGDIYISGIPYAD
jgi:hypothetical protein